VPLKAAAPPAAAKAAPAAAAKPPVAGGDAVKTQPRSQLVAPTLSPDAAAGLREALGQVLWACGSLRSDGASSCGEAAFPTFHGHEGTSRALDAKKQHHG